MYVLIPIPEFVDIGEIIGKGGVRIKSIEAETATSIMHNRRSADRTFKIFGKTQENMEKAVACILDVINDRAAKMDMPPLSRDEISLPQYPESFRQSSQHQDQPQPRTSARMSAEDALDAMSAAANMDFSVLTDDEKRRAYVAAKGIYRAFEQP